MVKILLAFMVALVGLAAAVGVTSADFALKDWRYFKPLAVPPQAGPDGLVEVVPDIELLARSSPFLADLRIIEAGQPLEVPYRLIVERGEVRRRPVPATIVDLSAVPRQLTSFIADLGPGAHLHNEIEIFTTSQNFQRRVTVEASNDRVAWAVLKEGHQILDVTIREQRFTTRNTRVTYPQSTVRYLRVIILNGPETPLQVTGAAVSSVIEVSPQHTPLPSVVVRREEQNAARTTLIEIDLGTYGAPNSRVAVTVPEKNFYRRMTLEGGDDGRTWTPVHQGDIYVFDSSTFRGNSLALDYPENTFRYLRVNVHNEDNPPLSIEKVSVFAFLHRIVFPTSPDKAYQIYYGNREARVPSYDLERVFPNLANQELPDAILGGEVLNPAFRPKAAPVTERFPWLTSVAVAGAALIIGLLLFRLLRQIRGHLPPP